MVLWTISTDIFKYLGKRLLGMMKCYFAGADGLGIFMTLLLCPGISMALTDSIPKEHQQLLFMQFVVKVKPNMPRLMDAWIDGLKRCFH